MIGRLLKDHQATLATAAVVLNVAARIPGVALTLVALPLAHSNLGEGEYARLMAALATAALLTLPFTGVNHVVRRRIIAAKPGRTNVEQGAVFVSALTLTAAYTALVALSCALLALLRVSTWDTALVVAISVCGSALNLLDNVRLAYNRHHATASLQLVCQLCAIGIVIIAGNWLTYVSFGLVFTVPVATASVASGLMLLRSKPFLVRGVPTEIVSIARQSVGPSVSDGAISALINGTVLYTNWYLPSPEAAWYATLVRLYNVAVAPVTLVLLPLTTFLAIRTGQTEGRDRTPRRAIPATAAAYGGICGLLLAFGGNYFIHRIMGLPHDAPLAALIACSTFFGGLLGFRAYALFVYTTQNGQALAYLSAALIAVASGAATLAGSANFGSSAFYPLAAFVGIGLFALIVSGLRKDKFVLHAGS